MYSPTTVVLIVAELVELIVGKEEAGREEWEGNWREGGTGKEGGRR